MPVKITSFEAENLKRIKAVHMEPTESGLTIIGGKNKQGKTSVLDAIMWGLGGKKFEPSNAKREDSAIPPTLKITLSNGVVVERSGKNSSLKVLDPSGNKSGQTLLDSFISQFALDLPMFMNANDKKKAETLLQIIGVGDKLFELDNKEKSLMNERLLTGRIADQKKKAADEMTFYKEAPSEMISAAELIKKQQEILAKNGENQKKRENVQKYRWDADVRRTHVEALKERLAEAISELEEVEENLRIAESDALDLVDESTGAIEDSIANIEEINRKVRANLDREKVLDEADHYSKQYDDYTLQIEEVRNERTALLDNSDLPLPGLSVVDGELTYMGQKWDNMSGAEQLIVSTAIVRKLNPECGFVLMDKLEQMDMDTLKEFGNYLEAEGLQVIATRVSTGDECSIIIEDGCVATSSKMEPVEENKSWEAGKF